MRHHWHDTSEYESGMMRSRQTYQILLVALNSYLLFARKATARMSFTQDKVLIYSLLLLLRPGQV